MTELAMFEVRDNGALPGLAEVVGQAPDAALEDRAVAQYAQVLSASGLPLPSTMGVGSNVRALIERIFYRKLKRELPQENCSLPWFECHVPPGGTAVARSSASSETSQGLELNIFGSGIGRGRKVSITTSSASAPRKACAIYRLDLIVKPHLYDIHGRESVELEIVNCLGQSLENLEKCPHCGVPPGSVDPIDFHFGQHLDLRADRVNSTFKFKLEIEDSSSIEAGVKLTSIPLALKLTSKVSRGYSFEVESEFPAGMRYIPYTRVGAGPL